MKTYAQPILDALAGSVLPLVTLVKMDFPSGTIALNASNYDIVYGGVTYKGANGLGQITPIADGDDGDPGGIKLELLYFDPSYISLALDDVDEVQGTPITIRTAILDADSHALLAAPLDWLGRADVMSMAEGGSTGGIALSAENKGVDLLHGNPLVYNDADQKALVPGDKFFEHTTSQTDQPVVWPAREWFHK